MALPIEAVIPDLVAALRRDGRAVLQAPPGAGKTTRVPLALAEAEIAGHRPDNRIVMLEPRRLAARAAATRMAATLNEAIGQRIGLRMRAETKTSPATCIEVVTEAVLTRMIQSDPGLDGVGLLIFDEFHERSLAADLGLALAVDVAALRPDLKLLVMSATLDAAPVADLISAEIVTSAGQGFPVDIQWLDRPLGRQSWLEQMPEIIRQALAETEGNVLAFLPGEAEIRKTASRLSDLEPSVMLRPLYARLDEKAQRAALAEESDGRRKLVLATSIAETSLTLPGITAVVDGGRARRARFDAASGLSRLVTERVSRAEADQRAGRAGRTAPGRAYRLWSRPEHGALAAFPPAEIEVADLADLALNLKLWGAAPSEMAFLTPPPATRLAEAEGLLAMLGALDGQGRITEHGRALAALPLHPRLGHMLVEAGADAAPLAALVMAPDPLRDAPADLSLRLEALRDATRFERKRGYVTDRGGLARIAQEAKRLSSFAPKRPPKPGLGEAEMAALAWPDRIGLRRKGDAPRYLLAGGKGAVTAADEKLGQSRMIIAVDLDGDPREAKLRRGFDFSERALRDLFAGQIETHRFCDWSTRSKRVEARIQERFGALVLTDQIWTDPPAEQLAAAFLEGVRQTGLGLSGAAARLQARVQLARQAGADLPDCSEAGLLDRLEEWLSPWVGGMRSAQDWHSFDALPALQAWLGQQALQRLETALPGHITTPLGRKLPITYEDGIGQIQARVQEFFGLTTHPMAAGQPVRLTLLSPAGRPVATTMDLPGFWAGGYHDMAKDMRGQYPRHHWPTNPAEAQATLRAKPRKS